MSSADVPTALGDSGKAFFGFNIGGSGKRLEELEFKSSSSSLKNLESNWLSGFDFPNKLGLPGMSSLPLFDDVVPPLGEATAFGFTDWTGYNLLVSFF